LNQRPSKSSVSASQSAGTLSNALSGSQSAGTLCNAVSESRETTLPEAEPVRSKHQRKQEQKAARKKNARRQQQVDTAAFDFSIVFCRVMHIVLIVLLTPSVVCLSVTSVCRGHIG